MPLVKKYAKDRATCKVTFSLPAEAAGNPRKLYLAGEFNHWSPTELSMRKSGGVFTASLTLQAGRQHQYRYVTDLGQWFNDTEADCYVYNAFAEADNSVAAL